MAPAIIMSEQGVRQGDPIGEGTSSSSALSDPSSH